MLSSVGRDTNFKALSSFNYEMPFPMILTIDTLVGMPNIVTHKFYPKRVAFPIEVTN